MTGNGTEAAPRRRLLRILGVLTALMILVLAAAVVGIVSFRTLQRHEGEVLAAWDEVRRVQDEQRTLAARLAAEPDPGPAAAAAFDRWRERQRALDTAPDFPTEVRAAAGIDAALADLVAVLEGAGLAAPGADRVRADLIRSLQDVNRRAAAARRIYNEAVGRYERNRARIPHRWFSGLFGYGPLPACLPAGER